MKCNSESVDCNEEEARPHFCYSILFPRSMYQPGYIQEGQGVIFGYLLLGIYHRRIPGDTVGKFFSKSVVGDGYRYGSVVSSCTRCVRKQMRRAS